MALRVVLFLLPKLDKLLKYSSPEPQVPIVGESGYESIPLLRIKGLMVNISRCSYPIEEK
jgi:hypothetical protein